MKMHPFPKSRIMMYIGGFVSIMFATIFSIVLALELKGSLFLFPQLIFSGTLILQQVRAFLNYVNDPIIEFPNEMLESGEKILHKLDNVWVKSKVSKVILFNFSIYKTHIVITNRRIIFSAVFFGKIKYKKGWGDDFYFIKPENERPLGFGHLVGLYYSEEKYPHVIIKGSKMNMRMEIYTLEAKEIYKSIKDIIEIES